MRFKAEISVGNIQLDRLPIGYRTFDLARKLDMGIVLKSKLPPIHVVKASSGRWQILDGRHRVLAFRLLGFKTILARWGERI